MIADHVTGLAPRGELERLLDSLLGGRSPQAVAVTICDVIGLKGVNERDGFLAGDAVLRTAADALRQAAPGADLLARLGGDELIAVFTGPAAADAARHAAATLAAWTAPPLRAAATIAAVAEPPGMLIDRLYAIMRES
jgi:diguanylate cyclase (GGDEF)-like protein